MTPAFSIRIFSDEDIDRKSAAKALTLWKEERSRVKRWTLSRSRTLPSAAFAFFTSRPVRYRVAPVFAKERAVSTPRPEEQPVMRMVFSVHFPSRPSAPMICDAVGRPSPGPLVPRVLLRMRT